ncbi:Ig-like repeat domain protein|nr:Ig-like repeat domain protein [Candidatus Pantoea persica]
MWVEDPVQEGFRFISIDSTEGLLADNITNDGAIAAYSFGGAALADIAAMFAGTNGGGGNATDAEQVLGDGDTGGDTTAPVAATNLL